MAVTVNNRAVQYTATASQTVFTYDFPIDNQSSLVVIKTDGTTKVNTTLTYSTNYTLTGVGDESGGTVVLTSGATAGDIYTIYGDTPEARNSDFTGVAQITPAALNTQFDNLTKQTQQNRRDIDRSIRVPITDNLDSIDMVVPSGASDRGDKYMKFSSNGLSLELDAGTTSSAPAGGSDTQIQYNNSGDLAGDSGFTTDGAGSINIVGDLDIDNINLNANAITTASGDLDITPSSGLTDFSASTEALHIPTGTTAQRPSSPAAGYIRFNTTTNNLESYDGSQWITQSGGSGDVTGPGSSTDNAVVRFDGTGGTLIQDSSVLIDDSDAVTGITSLDVDNININGNTISSTDTNGDVVIDPNGTGNVDIGNYTFDADQTVGAGQDDYVMTYDNSSGLVSLEAAASGGGGVQAYIYFTSITTTSITESSNVSSLTDNGTGDTTINFTNNFSSSTYSAAGCSAPGNGRWLSFYDGTVATASAAGALTASSCRVAYITLLDAVPQTLIFVGTLA